MAFPATLQTLATNKADGTNAATDHPAHHNALATEINAIEQTLGVNPQSSAATVAARISNHVGIWPSGIPGIVAPAPLHALHAGGLAVTANRIILQRTVIPKTGQLRDLHVFCVTASGNVQGAVFDLGQTTPNTRTRLWAGSSTVPTGNTWVNLGDPNLAVTEGQYLDLAFQPDNATATWARMVVNIAAFMQLPAGFSPQPGLSENTRLGSLADQGSFAIPATLGQSLSSLAGIFAIMARIS